MSASASPVEVGVRELKNDLSRYLDRVADGEELTVTRRGRPVARLLPADATTDRLADLIKAGVVQPPTSSRRTLPTPIKLDGGATVSDLVAEQRR
ncbi:MAG TPA: type II toxin-antitoxin system prevent-host-death family antitoxin [Acidimicrobiales bacterium]|jgi:prevent-host-death family protein